MRCDLRRLEPLFISIKACHDSVSTSSNDFLLLMFVFAERGEVSVGGKRPPAHATCILCFLKLFNFLCVHTGWTCWNTGGGVFTLVSSYTCNCIVSDPVTGCCSPLNTCMCSFMHLRLNPNISELQSGSLPHLLIHFFFFYYMSGCMHA